MTRVDGPNTRTTVRIGSTEGNVATVGKLPERARAFDGYGQTKRDSSPGPGPDRIVETVLADFGDLNYRLPSRSTRSNHAARTSPSLSSAPPLRSGLAPSTPAAIGRTRIPFRSGLVDGTSLVYGDRKQTSEAVFRIAGHPGEPATLGGLDDRHH